jgi:hypothetical protein
MIVRQRCDSDASSVAGQYARRDRKGLAPDEPGGREGGPL